MLRKVLKSSVIFVRHGESIWNKANRFTGWHDVPLSKTGVQESISAGQRIKANGIRVDHAFCSLLKRTVTCFNIIAEVLDIHHIPIVKTYRLNEKHYGALEGLNKAEMVKQYGAEKVKVWTRSFDVRPPPLPKEVVNVNIKANMEKYLPEVIPQSESLKDTVDRVVPFWIDQVCPLISKGKNLLIVTHGNTLRAIIKYLDNIKDEEIVDLNIPTGLPLVYEFDTHINVKSHYYLATHKELQERLKQYESVRMGRTN